MTYPLGGVFWDYVQYLIGLYRLGHDVIYVEDTGGWVYDPAAATFVEGGARNAGVFARRLAQIDPDLCARWFFRDARGTEYGQPWTKVASFCRQADLFIHVSGCCWMRDEYFSAKRVVLVDSDPMFTQASVPGYLAGTGDLEARRRIDGFRRHDVFFSFASNIRGAGCSVPSGLFDWIPTLQPVVLDQFEPYALPLSARRRVLTTVGSWRSATGPAIVDGVPYGGKDLELDRFIGMPARSALALELAIGGDAPAGRLRAHGWRVVDGYAVSSSPASYRSYLASSLGEWSIAKNAYVDSRSGWFSCRTACYLALGVPAIVQDTGFSQLLPTGEGLLAFNDVDQAAAAVERVAADPARHSRAARAIARAYFDSDRVLERLLREASK